MITVEATGTLLPWSIWVVTASRGNVPYRLPWVRTRERRLMFGCCEAARIIEMQMHSGVCQYIVSCTNMPAPKPKFDSFEQALDYLKELIP